jgi:hypothetical protein
MSQPMSHMTVVSRDCPVCDTTEDEVGAVLKDAKGVVACEGCRRQGKA